MANKYVIKNGTLVSVLDGSEQNTDILVEGGIVTRIEAGIDDAQAEVIDAKGMYISTGWLEAHAHFAGVDNSLNIDPQNDLLMQGVTYGLDLGTLGPDNFETGYEQVAAGTDMKFRCFLCISNDGIGGRAVDFEDPQDIDKEKVIACAQKNRDKLVGLKARIDDKFCFDPEYVMKALRELGDDLNLPIAVHAPRSRIGIDRLLSFLKKGDVLCHTLAGNSEVMDVLDADGKIRQSVLDAQKRGVIFELSHGSNAYSYETAEAAWNAGFFVDTVCSDIHGRNVNGPVFSPSVIYTKVHGLTGKPWWWILNKSIVAPVELQNLSDKAVDVCVGSPADLTIYRIENGEFTYLDSKKVARTFSEKITPCYTCIGTKVVSCH